MVSPILIFLTIIGHNRPSDRLTHKSVRTPVLRWVCQERPVTPG